MLDLKKKVKSIDIPDTLCTPWGVTLKLLPVTEKKRHFWLWSSTPNQGKTTWVEQELQKLNSYEYVVGEKYQTIHTLCRIITLDEYNTASLKVSELNKMCDNSTTYLVKGGTGVKLSEKPYIFILCNKSIETLYPNMYELIKARFIEVEVKLCSTQNPVLIP